MEECIRYVKGNGIKRKMCTMEQKIWLKLYNSPMRRFAFVSKKLKQVFAFPLSTSFGLGLDITAQYIELGENVGLGENFKVVAWAPIKIGDGTSFSFNNTLITSTHDFNDFSIVIGKPIVIGKNSWITTGVTILPGVNIGDNTIIGAGSVVTHDIPSGVLAAGNPCEVIKSIKFRR